jgi:hypothetical protein
MRCGACGGYERTWAVEGGAPPSDHIHNGSFRTQQYTYREVLTSRGLLVDDKRTKGAASLSAPGE